MKAIVSHEVALERLERHFRRDALRQVSWRFVDMVPEPVSNKQTRSNMQFGMQLHRYLEQLEERFWPSGDSSGAFVIDARDQGGPDA